MAGEEKRHRKKLQRTVTGSLASDITILRSSNEHKCKKGIRKRTEDRNSGEKRDKALQIILILGHVPENDLNTK